MICLKNKDFLKLLDFTPEEIAYLLELAADLKAKKKAGIPHALCQGKNIALIFEKTSTRTRCAFVVAGHDLGMGVTYLDPTGSQIGKKESIADTARVLSRMFDGIEYRGFGQSIVEELAQYADVPVWNGLTNEFHPTQILADAECQAIAMETGATLEFQTDPAKAVQGADVVYTDVWVSMGEPVEVWKERIADLAPYQVNAQLMAQAGEKAVFMHCLPAFHDHKTIVGKEMGEAFGRDAMEVTDEVFEGPQSIVFDEAENRMHTIKAVMAATLAG